MNHSTAAANTRPTDRGFFGHPKGLAYLSFTEAWERFSFYGMQALLMLYLVQHLLHPDVAAGVFGLGPLRAALERLTGPLSEQAFASQIFGWYSGLVYFTPVFGGLLADRVLGQRRTVLLGAALMVAGHLLMALEAAFLPALVLLVAGSGCLKGNISVQVGQLYGAHEEGRRSRAFAIFSAAINVGALFGPLVCAVVAQVWGWHMGFAVAGVMMLVAMGIYIAGRRYLPPDVLRQREALPRAPLTAHDWRVIVALVLVSLLAVLPAAAYNQEMIAGMLFIEASVDRSFLGWMLPTSGFNALDGLFCIVFVPPLVALWRRQAQRGREPGELGKIAIGYLITALASVAMVWPAARAEAGQTVGVVWPVLLFALNALGFLYYWPTLLALFSRAAPAAVNSTLMGVLFFSTFLGNVASGFFGGGWETMGHAHFFWLHAALSLGPFVLTLLTLRPLERLFASSAPCAPAAPMPRPPSG
ncbi:MAG: peptide MFS transporter [Xanthomonadaceae bacterium]|nr:peptide MFS transporter [Xanthomonadaceae bacterium]MCA0197713.1 peptide MFS transporter [Pseudomonadota bacterium]